MRHKFLTKNTKMFLSYVFPSMIGMLIAGSYSIIDTIFIGRNAGELGLAAVAITWPLVFLFNAVGDTLGTGASIIVSQSRGCGDITRARSVFGNMLIMLLVCSAVMGIGLYKFLPDILLMLGAKSEFMPMSLAYARVMIYFNLASMLAMSLSSLVRNDGRPVLSMWITVLGLGLNIILDYLFIFPFGFGVVGAAYATILSQSISAAVGLGYFATKHTKLRYGADMLRLRMSSIRDMFVCGIPALGNELSIILMMLLHNYQALKYGDTAGLAAYTFVGSVESVGALLMTGLSLGVLPLVAYLYGSGRNIRQNIIGNMGYYTAFVLGIIMMTVSLVGHTFLPGIFNLHGSVAQLAGHALVLSSFAFVFLGVIRVAGYYYQATGKIRASSLLIYGDAFCVLPLCLFVLPLFFGLNGVWLAMPVSRVILFGILCWLWFGRGNARQRVLAVRGRIRKLECAVRQ